MTTNAPPTIQRIARTTWRTSDTAAALDLFLQRGYAWASIQHPTDFARLVLGGAKVLIRRSGHIVVSGGDPGGALALLDAAERSVTR